MFTPLIPARKYANVFYFKCAIHHKAFLYVITLNKKRTVLVDLIIGQMLIACFWLYERCTRLNPYTYDNLYTNV